MSKRESFPLRMDPRLMAALRKWADDDLRSINGQIEFLLREALRTAKRLPATDKPSANADARSNKRG